MIKTLLFLDDVTTKSGISHMVVEQIVILFYEKFVS